MKLKYLSIMGAVLLLNMQPANAAVNMVKGADLAKNSNCMACHTITKKLIGPAFLDIARKYSGNKAAEESLFKKVKSGGTGVWGSIPMPANGPKVSDADIKILVEWILSH